MSRSALVLALLGAVFLAETGRIRNGTSLTLDEPHYLTYGRLTVENGELHPGLVELGIAPLPVLLHCVIPVTLRRASGRDPAWTSPEQDPEWILGPRLASSLIFGLPLIVLVYFWLSRRRGARAGIAGAAMVSLSPGIVAHSALATTDVALAFFALLAMAAQSRFHRTRRPLDLGLAAVATGAAMAAKYSGLFDLFGDTIRLAADSFLALADRWFWMDIVLVIVLAGVTRRSLARPAPRPRHRVLAGLTLYVLFSMGTRSRGGLAHLDEHPFFAACRADRAVPESLRPLDRGVFSARYGGGEPAPPGEHEALAGARSALRNVEKPHVVLVVLESVGAHALLGEDGRPRGDVAPFLASRADVIFDTVYSPWPGTVRSHASLLTGGRTITWGSASGEFSRPFTGSTLPRLLAARGYRTAAFSAGDDVVHNLQAVYRNLGFEHYWHFGSASHEFQSAHRVSSWGGGRAAGGRRGTRVVGRGARA